MLFGATEENCGEKGPNYENSEDYDSQGCAKSVSRCGEASTNVQIEDTVVCHLQVRFYHVTNPHIVE